MFRVRMKMTYRNFLQFRCNLTSSNTRQLPKWSKVPFEYICCVFEDSNDKQTLVVCPICEHYKDLTQVTNESFTLLRVVGSSVCRRNHGSARKSYRRISPKRREFILSLLLRSCM